jgi:hypothetical protein
MPALQHWFTGGALAAFLAFLAAVPTLGYAWYRAALSEQKAFISDKKATAQKLKAEQTRGALQEFYMEVGSIIARPLPKDISDEDFRKYANEADEWVTRTANWISNNMGVAAMARFLDRTGMNDASYLRAVNAAHNSIILNLTRHRQNLLVLMETPAWSGSQH